MKNKRKEKSPFVITIIHTGFNLCAIAINLFSAQRGSKTDEK